jgi:hypothetical protein
MKNFGFVINHAAARLISRGPFRHRFWLHAVGIGIALPVVMLGPFAGNAPPAPLAVLASLMALYGLYVFEELWVKADQAMPLS